LRLPTDNNGKVSFAKVREYYKTRDEAIEEFYLLNFCCTGLPSDPRRVINLQQQDSLDLLTMERLATIEAQSKEEAKAKVNDVEEEMEDAVEMVAQGSPYRQGKFQWQQHRQNQFSQGSN
jgi:hypothetical protein